MNGKIIVLALTLAIVSGVYIGLLWRCLEECNEKYIMAGCLTFVYIIWVLFISRSYNDYRENEIIENKKNPKR